jgi:uncharacterized radical SAM superfamily Fe-S cluster-containing enzyme
MLAGPAPVERLLHETTSLCQHCKNAVPAQVMAVGNEVHMRKRCKVHGPQSVMLSDDAGWYERTRAIPTPPAPPVVRKEVEHGCPFDCGACSSHEQKVRLPVVTITSACNLNCPICYVHNKNEGAFHMSLAEFDSILGHLVRDHGGDLDLINFTGGEPTVHPHFLEFIEHAQKAGVHRVTICTNGIKLAQDEALVKRLGELRARVALSFDSFEPTVDQAMQGARLLDIKFRCLDLLDKHDVDTTLIPVMTRGYNDHEIGRIIQLGLDRKCVRHLEVHTITYTGQGGVSFDRSGRISMHEVLRRIEETTGGLLREEDFVASPCAHPLCYQIAYMLLDPEGGAPVPFTRFMPRDTFYKALGERLYLEPSPFLETAMHDAIDRLFAFGGDEAERTLRMLKHLLAVLFPQGRVLSREEGLRASERWVKAVYIHSHMDEETFDVERVMRCCDSNCYADGTTIPVCNYNVLYREKEAKFMRAPKAWNERSGGFKLPVLHGGKGK